jgi:hypothetical protein
MALKISKPKQRSSVEYAPSAAADTQDVRSLDLPTMAWPLEQLLQFQAELLKVADPGLTDWLNRRREGTSAVLRTLERLAACRDVGEAVAIQSDWIDGAMKRLDLETQAIVEQALAVSQCATGATREVAQTTTELATRGAEWVTRKVETDTQPAGRQSAPPTARASAAELQSNQASAPELMQRPSAHNGNSGN